MVMGHAFMAEIELVVVRISVDLSCWYTKVQIVEKLLSGREQRKEPLGNFFDINAQSANLSAILTSESSSMSQKISYMHGIWLLEDNELSYQNCFSEI